MTARRDALRQSAKVPGGDPRALLDAVLTELDAAIDALAGARETSVSDGPAIPETVRAERKLLHEVFQEAPVPLFLLETDGTIRRASARAAGLLGAPAGYATGKALTVFVDLPLRAAVQTQLAAVARTGTPRRSATRLSTPAGPQDAIIDVSAITLPGEAPLLVATVLPVRAGSVAPAAADGDPAGPDTAADGGGRDIRLVTQRMDMVVAVTRLLLDNSTFSEAVTLQRCARLLAGEMADWVIVDVERDGKLRRQVVAGPRDRNAGETVQAEEAVRTVRGAGPVPGSLPWQVHESREPALLAQVEDASVLGAGTDGTPVVMTLGATSLLAVPISDEHASYGTLTLARTGGASASGASASGAPTSGAPTSTASTGTASTGSPRTTAASFDLADLALAAELGGHLGIAMRVDRMFRRRSETAEALQASLLPERLPEIPGLELAAAYVGASQWQETSGDFYDVFGVGDEQAIMIGDVCGRGQEAAAVTAAARHTIRALAYVPAYDCPETLLTAANEVLLGGDYGERFVTVSLAFVRRKGRKLQVRLGNSGHPGPAVLRADGRVEILEGDGLPLGLLPEAPPSTASVELAQGDLLFFYTDGVTGARSAEQGFFEDRLADSLAAMAGRSASDTVRAVQELVTEFSGGELRDDVTILAVRAG
ncbi:MAG TPA: SpoIIE family protein phosphatase [Trebonia sp.]|jgi:serine phosphatase RsbU (regulator of sigma subunit)